MCPAAVAGSLPPSWAGSKLPGVTLHAPQGKSLQNSTFLGSRYHTGTFHCVLMKGTTPARGTSGRVLYRDGASCCHPSLRGQVCQAVVYRQTGSCLSCLESQEILPWKRTHTDKLPSSNLGLLNLQKSPQVTVPDVQCLQGRAHKQAQRSGPGAGGVLPSLHLSVP